MNSVPKIMTFLPTLPSADKNSARESNPILWPLYTYLSRSAFVVVLTAPSKQLFRVK